MSLRSRPAIFAVFGFVFAAMLCLLPSVLLARYWQGPSALDGNEVYEHPLSPEELELPKPGCVPPLCLREIRDLCQSLEKAMNGLPAGRKDRPDPWLARAQSAHKKAITFRDSMLQRDCFLLAESLCVMIKGFKDVDSDYPRTPEFGAIFLATQKVRRTMQMALSLHLEERRWIIDETDIKRLCMACLLSETYFYLEGWNPDKQGKFHYSVRMADLFSLSPEGVFRFIEDPGHAELISWALAWFEGDFPRTDWKAYLSDKRIPDALRKRVSSSPEHLQTLYDASQRRMAETHCNNNVMNPEDRPEVGKFSKVERWGILSFRNQLLITLGGNLHCRKKRWFMDYEGVLADLNRAARTNTPSGILDVLPALCENRLRGERWWEHMKTTEGDDAYPGLPLDDGFLFSVNRIMIEYIKDSEKGISDKRMRQLLAGSFAHSGSCLEGYEPFFMSSFTLLLLYPDQYMESVKSLPEDWIKRFIGSEEEDIPHDWDAYKRNLKELDPYWENRFEENLARNQAKIEKTEREVRRWIHKRNGTP